MDLYLFSKDLTSIHYSICMSVLCQCYAMVTTRRKMARIMIGVTLKHIKSTEWIQKQSGLTDIIRSIRESKHRWAGHVARRRDNRWTISVTECIPRGNKRPRGRPRTKWSDDLIQYVDPLGVALRKTGGCVEHVERGSSLEREKRPE